MNTLLFYFACAVVTFGVSWYYVVNYEAFCHEAFASFRLHSKEEADEMGRYYENSIKVYQPIVRMACIQSASLSASCFLLVAAGLRGGIMLFLMILQMVCLLIVVAEGWYIWFMTIAKEKMYFETDTTEEAERHFEALKKKLLIRNFKNYKWIKRMLYGGVGINGTLLIAVILYFFTLS
ncbi:MAG: hypothetical protein ACRCW2_11905 [Cellulosilyticaceae bacterium]